jgi:lipid-binding SYLF domain-containing protein
MLFMNEHAFQSLLSDKFKLGADASVAGPVGRKTADSTGLKLNEEILSYSCSKGDFSRVILDGAVVQAETNAGTRHYTEVRWTGTTSWTASVQFWIRQGD